MDPLTTAVLVSVCHVAHGAGAVMVGFSMVMANRPYFEICRMAKERAPLLTSTVQGSALDACRTQYRNWTLFMAVGFGLMLVAYFSKTWLERPYLAEIYKYDLSGQVIPEGTNDAETGLPPSP